MLLTLGQLQVHVTKKIMSLDIHPPGAGWLISHPILKQICITALSLSSFTKWCMKIERKSEN